MQFLCHFSLEIFHSEWIGQHRWAKTKHRPFLPPQGVPAWKSRFSFGKPYHHRGEALLSSYFPNSFSLLKPSKENTGLFSHHRQSLPEKEDFHSENHPTTEVKPYSSSFFPFSTEAKPLVGRNALLSAPSLSLVCRQPPTPHCTLRDRSDFFLPNFGLLWVCCFDASKLSVG